MRVGDLVECESWSFSKMGPGIIIEVGLVDIDDTGLEYEEKECVRVSWPSGVSVHFNDELEVIT